MRRIYIIEKEIKITDAILKEAKKAGCTEIVNGIPSSLVGQLSEVSLPIIYEEPEQPINPEPVTLDDALRMIEDLNSSIEALRLSTQDQYNSIEARLKQLEPTEEVTE